MKLSKNFDTKEYHKKYWEIYYKKNKDIILEQNRKYYVENKEKISEQGKIYYGKNKEKISEKVKQYYIKHKEQKKQYCKINCQQISDYQKQYRKTHSEKMIELREKWQGNNPKKVREASRRHKSKRRYLGFEPLNNFFENSEAHHIDKNYIVYIPRKIHKSIIHCLESGKNMDKINNIAMKFVLENT